MARKGRMDMETVLCCLEKRMLRLFQEEVVSGLVGLCCKAATGSLYRKVLCLALG